MEAEGQLAEDFVTEEICQGHQRPVIVADSLRTLKAPDVAAENPAEISKAVDIWIFQNLLAVVIDEAVGERIQVGQGRQQNQNEEDGGIAIISGLPA
jgi:hypothetical protein